MGRNKSKKQSLPQPKKLLKDPGVPKLIAMKAKIEMKRHKNKLPPKTNSLQIADSMEVSPSISGLAALAAAEDQAEAEELNSGEPSSGLRLLKRQFIRTLHKVIDQSDLILLVLDARDPEGCRSKLVEDEVLRRESDGKKLIFILNKIDLIPRTNAEAWLKHLRHTAPTLPFKSSTQEQRSNLTSRTSPFLLNLIKSYKPPSASITVGVVGYPNVGKSSLINSLKRARVCGVAADPGWTRELQSVALERGLRIIDSPGVVFDDATSPSALLRNVLKPEDIPDPQAVVEEILSRTSIETIQSIYKLPPDPPFRNATEFLTMVALTTGRLGSGGVPDLAAAATQVMRDWNNSKIPYFTEPPAIHPSQMPSAAPGADNVGEMTIVTAWKPEFDLGGLYGGADKVTFDDGMQEDEDPMEQDNLLPIAGQKRPHSPDPDSASEDGLNPPASLTSSSMRLPKPKRTKREALSYDVEMDAQMESANPFSRKSLKKDAKRTRKEAGRRERERQVGMRVDQQEDGDGNDMGSPFTFRANIDGRISI